MSTIRRNLLANIAGSGWSVLISLAFVPVYLHFLGMEAYGLIGIFLALVAILSLLDLGLGTVVNRELARLSVQPDAAQRMRNTLRTLELVYWVIGVVIGLVVAALAPLAAAYWVNAEQLAQETVERAVVIMGLAIAFQWPLTLYTGGLSGLQHQVMLNAITALISTVRNAGAALILWQVSDTIEAFLVWQVAMNLFQTAATGAVLWRSLPAASSGRFELGLLSEIWRFAAGMTGMSVMAVILTQLDKVILSKVLPLDAFGYYSLAWRLASGLYQLVGPIGAAFFPRLSQLAAGDNKQELAQFYHRSCQFMSVVVVPITLVIALFSQEFLLVWTGDPTVAAKSSVLLTLLVIGTGIMGLMNLPVALQLAYGWTRLGFVFNAVAVALIAPAIFLMSLSYGAEGAAGVWVLLNCGYVTLMLPIMHRRLLPSHLHKWYLADVGMPLAAALAVAIAWKFTMGMTGSYAVMVLDLAVACVLIALAAALAAANIRVLIFQQLMRSFRRRAGL